MVYVCENCGVLFSRASKQDHCPGCGKNLIRSANPVERHEYATQIVELIRESCLNELRFPHMVETEIFVPNSFGFMLPATAVQIDSDMVVEITVEYGQNAADRKDLTANVWARQASGTQIDFLLPLHLPVMQGETAQGQIDRIFSALNGNSMFTARLHDYITEQLERQGE